MNVNTEGVFNENPWILTFIILKATKILEGRNWDVKIMNNKEKNSIYHIVNVKQLLVFCCIMSIPFVFMSRGIKENRKQQHGTPKSGTNKENISSDWNSTIILLLKVIYVIKFTWILNTHYTRIFYNLHKIERE